MTNAVEWSILALRMGATGGESRYTMALERQKQAKNGTHFFSTVPLLGEMAPLLGGMVPLLGATGDK